MNLYLYTTNDPVNWVDPTGEGKSKVIGWIVKRVGGKLIRTASVFTHKQAAKMFNKGFDVLVKEGFDSAKKVANIAIEKSGQVIHRGGHILRGGSRGLSHIQSRRGPARHIFYGVVAAVAAGATAADASGQESKPFSVDVTEVYKDHYPGKSAAHALTFSHWFGEDSLASWLDWVNPGELVAAAGDAGRWIDRELNKELIGYSVTLLKQGEPKYTVSMDKSGQLVSVSKWIGSQDIEVTLDAELEKPLDGEAGRATLDFLEEFLKGMGAADQPASKK